MITSRITHLVCAAVLATLALACNANSYSADASTEAALELFEKKCQECHHPDTDDEFPYFHKGVTVEDLTANDGGVVPGRPDDSEVYQRVTLDESSRKRMPKSKGAPGDELHREPLTADEQKLLHDWIAGLDGGSTPTPTPAAEKPEEPAQPKPETIAAAAEVDDVFPAAVDLNEQVHFIFENHCVRCHNPNKRREPTLSAAVDLASLLRSGAGEDIHARITLPDADGDRMPPSEGDPGEDGYVAALSAEEKDAISKWLASSDQKGAAKREPISFTTVLDQIRRDLDENESSARHLRYLTLTNLYNAHDEDGLPEIGDEMMNSHRAGVSKLINSLSMDGKITAPKAIDEQRTVYRIDLRDYDWTRKDWERVVSYYPHGILGIDGRTENLIHEYTGSDMAYLRADWFAFAVAQPPLYDEIVNRMLDIDDLSAEGAQGRIEHGLGVDRIHNLQNGEAVRAGFLDSGVSDHNRLIERHESDYGAYWISYDFKRIGAGPHQDLRKAPLGPADAHLTSDPDHVFEHDGGEMVFTLPNGLQSYLLATHDGTRLQRAPSDIVRDANRPDRIIINGISCIKCHDKGIKPALDTPLDLKPGQEWDIASMGPNPKTLAGMTDEIGPFVIESGLIGGEERRLMEKLYVAPEELRRLVMLDHERFVEASDRATDGMASATTEPVAGLYDSYFVENIDAMRLSSELGMERDEMLRLLERESFSSESIRTLYLALKNGQAEPRDQILLSWISLVYLLGYELMPFEPLGYEEFDGEAHAKQIRDSETYLTLFSGDKTAAEIKAAIISKDTVLDAQSARSVSLGDGKKLIAQVDSKITAGEKGELLLQTEKDVHVVILHFSADDHVTQFFPNDADTDNLLKAKGSSGKQNTKTIPFLTTPNDGDEKGGPEYFVIYASEDEIEIDADSVKAGVYDVYDRDDVYSSRGIATALVSTDSESKTVKALSDIVEVRVGYLLVE